MQFSRNASIRSRESVGCGEAAAHDEGHRPSRRSFLQAAAASFGVLATAGLPVPVLAQKGGKGAVTRYPLRIPPTFSPYPYSLSAASTTLANLLGNGKTALALTYNGYFPGPTFRANSGAFAQVDLVNALSEETTIHWHGMIVPIPSRRPSPGCGGARRKLPIRLPDQSASLHELVSPAPAHADW